MHHEGVLDVTVGEHDLVNFVMPADAAKIRLIEDWNAVGIELTRKRRWIPAAGNAGDLRCRECHDPVCRVIPIDDIEIVEIAAGRPHDDDASRPCAT